MSQEGACAGAGTRALAERPPTCETRESSGACSLPHQAHWHFMGQPLSSLPLHSAHLTRVLPPLPNPLKSPWATTGGHGTWDLGE